jgi:hypothetical protein
MGMTPIDRYCECSFDVDPDCEDENTLDTTWHYKRVCGHCDMVKWALHCWHDRPRWRCGYCDKVNET